MPLVIQIDDVPDGYPRACKAPSPPIEEELSQPAGLSAAEARRTTGTSTAGRPAGQLANCYKP